MDTVTVLLNIDDDDISLAAGLGLVGDALDVGINLLSSVIAENVSRIEGTDLSGASEEVVIIISLLVDAGLILRDMLVVTIDMVGVVDTASGLYNII